MKSDEILPDGTFKLDQPVRLPEVLDILIVGGGPAGTAAAFRTRELGLTALVIDYDDLMKRIRDYAEDKPILPSFGGGDQIQFPKGGELVSQLAFSDIHKDEMCRLWKDIYRRHNIPAQLGVELLGLEEAEGGLWRVRGWNHNTRAEQFFLAKHVVIAVGRGVPRTFDIPGNLDGMAFRLSDPKNLVGCPALVIGGGTSAAEAVIAVSNAKAQAGDTAEIYWSYRGEKMPKVSRALAGVFLDAFAGNGNIRYLPHSEPVSVFAAPDGQEYLCLRIARKQLPEKPIETVHLEFSKEHCIACIGEDLPVDLLNSMGIYQVSGGPKNRKRLVVSPLLETHRPNLYLAGDILSPAYLETVDPEGDPSSFREIKRRGNVKSALRDGVLVSEVIAQKLEGKTDIHVRLAFTDHADEARGKAPGRPSAAAPSGARLIRLEGTVRMDEFPLRPDGETSIGQKDCDITFEQDSALSERHAVVSAGPGGFLLRDEGSRNGVFLQPTAGRPVEVTVGMVVRAGNQWLVFGGEGNPNSLVHYDNKGREVQRIQLGEETLVLGRQAPVNLDAADNALSRRHLSISAKNGKRFIRDLESVNGTHLKVDFPTVIRNGDRVWLGRQVLEFSSGEELAPASEVTYDTQGGITAPAKAIRRTQPADVDGPPLPEGLMVRFENRGKTLSIRKGQTICELAEEHGLKIAAQCHRGICGSDPIRILSGHENLNPMSEGEAETLDDLCSLDDGRHRLACMSRPSGPVVVEILED